MAYHLYHSVSVKITQNQRTAAPLFFVFDELDTFFFSVSDVLFMYVTFA